MSKKKVKVAMAMSGGVDSSVAAALLKKQGYDVVGIFMHFWSDPHYTEQKINNKCCSLDAFNDARRVAKVLDFPIYTLNFKESFKQDIVDDFLKQYDKGLTPNPCVRCNQFIKFGLFIKKAKNLGCQFIATGHYAQIKKDKNKVRLFKGVDDAKDQSYFLHQLTPNILKHCIFPVGKYKKDHVRKLAEKFKLPVSQKRDSQEICFVPEKEHYDFLQRHLKLKAGDIVTTAGKKIGKHKGLALYTIGQRKGIELNDGPWYVVELNVSKNKLVVTNSSKQEELFHDIMNVGEINWINKVKLPVELDVKIRYLHDNQKAVLDNDKNGLLRITFKEKQRAITPGQYAVFYKAKEVLGGGIIKEVK